MMIGRQAGCERRHQNEVMHHRVEALRRAAQKTRETDSDVSPAKPGFSKEANS
jgi:hypothetical protein